MKAIVLAAGYATRLYPLTKDTPKPLLEINGKPMMDYIMEKIVGIGVKEVFVVTNDKFYESFKAWADNYEGGVEKVKVVNDGTTSNDDRLGAIGDMKFVIEREKLDGDLLVIGADNLFDFTLDKAYELFLEKNESVVLAYDVKDFELAKKYGLLEVDSNNRIVSFQEKPANPKTTLASMCAYFYPAKTLPLIDKYLEEGNNPDSPGNFPVWLVKNYVAYAAVYDGKWFDVGSFESLKDAKEAFGEENVDIEELKKQ